MKKLIALLLLTLTLFGCASKKVIVKDCKDKGSNIYECYEL